MKNPSAANPLPEGVDRQLSIFVVGYPRSGTTLLRRMVSAHPDLCILPETLALRHVAAAARDGIATIEDAARLFDTMLERDRAVFDRAAFLEAAEARLPLDAARTFSLLYATAPMAADRPGARLGHKFPNDTPSVPTLARWYPDAQFVHIHRDPVAAIGSLFAHGLQGRARHPEIAAWHWRHYARLLERAEAGPLKGRLHALPMAELTASPEPVLANLCAALGVDPSHAADMAAPDRDDHATERDEATRPHMRRSRTGLDAVSEAAKDRLSPAAERRISLICGPEMQRLGYARGAGSGPIERLAVSGLMLGTGSAFAALRARRRLRGEI